MTFYHDNKLTVVGLDSDSDEKSQAPLRSAKRKRFCDEPHFTMPGSSLNVGTLGGDSSPPSPFYANGGLDTVQQYEDAYPPFSNTFDSTYEDALPTDYGLELEMNRDFSFPSNNSAYDTPCMTAAADNEEDRAMVENSGTIVKSEDGMEHQVSLTPNGGSEYEESDYDERRPSKVPKMNKDGVPRKPRQPRPKLLKWDDNDWKNVALGLVWACGENGIQIPFDQASQIVSESCTAGALQQALLKLRGKQVAEGFQIPSLRMAWTRKNKNTSSSSSSANTKPPQGTEKNPLPKKRPTRFSGNQTKMVCLKRAYKDSDRQHLVPPYKLKDGPAQPKIRQPLELATPPQTPTTAAGASNHFVDSFGPLSLVSALGYADLSVPSYQNSDAQQEVDIGGYINFAPPSTIRHALLTKLQLVQEEDQEDTAYDGALEMTAQHGFATTPQPSVVPSVQNSSAGQILNTIAMPTKNAPATPTRSEPATPTQNAPTAPGRKHRRMKSIRDLPITPGTPRDPTTPGTPSTPRTPTRTGPNAASQNARRPNLGGNQSVLDDSFMLQPFMNQGFGNQSLTGQGFVTHGLPGRRVVDEGDMINLDYADPAVQEPWFNFSGFHP